jgi:dihydrofolate synthase/folylpolyglutamate synthase
MFVSYQETLAYLYDTLPMFQRVGAVALTKDLTNTLKLLEALDNPHRKFKSVHITGTNGKGSTSHMLASVFQSAGYRTGLYTSPHLKEFTERIRVDGKEVEREFVIDFVNRIRPVMEEIQPSFFEITVAMAFDFFVFRKVDVAVVEVGLGGRLDSTNVITPELSVITNIGWDHKDLLGDTLEKIAFEKAGIIKAGIPAVVSERQKETEHVFIQRAAEMKASLDFGSDHYRIVDEGSGFTAYRDNKVVCKISDFPLRGFYQRKNLAGVLEAIRILNQGSFRLPDTAVEKGLSQVTELTGLKGRWQVLGRQPLVVCDTGHNLDGIKEVAAQIAAQSYRRLYIVWGAVKDKDVSGILRLLPKDANYYFCQAKIPRAMDAHQLKELAAQAGLAGEVIVDVNDALKHARSVASPEDMIFVGGK